MMKKIILVLAAVAIMAAPITAMAAMDHSGHMMAMGKAAHEEVVDGVKATFKVISMKERMKGMEMPKGMKETHHLMVELKDARSGKALTEGEVKVKFQGPDKAEQMKELMGMEGHFGADFDLSKKGKYNVMAKFKLKDGKMGSIMFPYVVK